MTLRRPPASCTGDDDRTWNTTRRARGYPSAIERPSGAVRSGHNGGGCDASTVPTRESPVRSGLGDSRPRLGDLGAAHGTEGDGRVHLERWLGCTRPARGRAGPGWRSLRRCRLHGRHAFYSRFVMELPSNPNATPVAAFAPTHSDVTTSSPGHPRAGKAVPRRKGPLRGVVARR